MRLGAALVAAVLWLAPLAAAAEDAPAGKPGDFDFYVMALSWSPSYCEAEGDGADPVQCDRPRPFAFVLHGLWPQYEQGYPAFCNTDPDEAPSRRLVTSLTDIIPSPGLIRHQWRKHGSCSGLDAATFFTLARKAYGAVRIPPAFTKVDRHVTVEPKAVEAAFRAANPGLAANGIAVTCDSRRLREVRICLTKDLRFRPCEEVDADGCRRDRVVMPPVR